MCMGEVFAFFSPQKSGFLKECNRLLLFLVILSARQLFSELKLKQLRQGQSNQKQISALM